MGSVAIQPRRRLPKFEDRHGVLVLPQNRGDIREAIRSAEALNRINPTSPRNHIMLQHVRFSEELTASDIILFELMLSVAKRDELRMVPYAIPVADVLKFMGWQANRSYLEASIKRLCWAQMTIAVSRPYWRRKGSLPLIHPSSSIIEHDGQSLFTFLLPDIVLDLMALRHRYEHIELRAISQMRSRWSIALYKWLVLRSRRPYVDTRPGADAFIQGFPVSVEPRRLAREIGWLKPRQEFKFGEFRREVLNRVMTDLAHVRAFGVSNDIRHGTGRGHPAEQIVFTIHPRTPDWRVLKTPGRKRIDELHAELSALDAPEVQVQACLFERGSFYLGVDARTLYYAWLLALHEACSGQALNTGYASRRYRGDRLLADIEKVGVHDACWHFILEEFQNLYSTETPYGCDSVMPYASDQDLRVRAVNARLERLATSSLVLGEQVRAGIQPVDSRALGQIALDHDRRIREELERANRHGFSRLSGAIGYWPEDEEQEPGLTEEESTLLECEEIASNRLVEHLESSLPHDYGVASGEFDDVPEPA